MNKLLNKISVDVVLPNYNSAPYLSETINSVINQTFKNWKLIIVDGNSNAETQKILKNYDNYSNISIIRLKKNKKAGFCRNLAMRNSKSDFVAFIDSDDIWDKEKLSKQLNFMIKNKYCFTYTNYTTFKSEEKQNSLKEIKPEKIFTFNKFVKNTSIGTSTMIIEKSSIGKTDLSSLEESAEGLKEKIYHSNLADRDEQHYGVKWKKTVNMRKELFNSKKSLKKSIIIKEILDSPLSLRK